MRSENLKHDFTFRSYNLGWPLSFLAVIVFLLISLNVKAQSAKVTMGPTEIALNEYYTITLAVENDNIRSYGGFPDIEGMDKRGTTSSTSTNIINGRMSYTQSIIQRYQARKEGTYAVNPFQIKVNDKEVNGSGASVKVGPARQQQQRRNPFFTDPFDDFFDRRQPQEPEYLDVNADAFFAVIPDKQSVYVGEGVNVTVAFYVGNDNKAEMQFYDISNQLGEVLKKVRPQNVWEENFNIEQITPENVKLGDKTYTRYKLFEANFYPLNDQPLTFPSAGLRMIKYKVAKNPTFFGRNRQQDFETFYSKPRIVKVKPLPEHPLKDQVAVGRYRLEEDINSDVTEAGGSISYAFKVTGVGNIANLPEPMIEESEEIDIYTPDIRQNIYRGNGTVSGSKVYDYYIMPSEPGEYALSDYLSWIYFDPEREVYDTLSPTRTFTVTGASLKNMNIASNGISGFYDRIGFTDNTLSSFDRINWLRWSVNAILLFVLIATLFLIFKKK